MFLSFVEMQHPYIYVLRQIEEKRLARLTFRSSARKNSVERARVWNSIGCVELLPSDHADLCLGKSHENATRRFDLREQPNKFLREFRKKKTWRVQAKSFAFENFFVKATSDVPFISFLKFHRAFSSLRRNEILAILATHALTYRDVIVFLGRQSIC